MKITDLLSLDTIELNVSAISKNDILDKAVNLMAKAKVINDIKTFKNGILAREKESTTGVGDGVAIPHCKSSVVTKPHLVAMVIPNGVEFESLDAQPVKLLFMIAAPNTKDNVHLDVLAKLSSMLMDEKFVSSLIKAKTKYEFLDVIDRAEKAKDEHSNVEIKSRSEKVVYLVGTTACPTGIAHTYMAQEALEKAAEELGVFIKVETNGSGGQKNTLTKEEIDRAQCVIVAADAFIEMDRFNGKRVIQCSTSQAIKDAKTIIKAALQTNVPIYGKKSVVRSSTPSKEFEVKQSKFQIFYRHLMSGISHMIPFIVAGGILLAIGFLADGIAGAQPTESDFGQHSLVAKIFHMLGGDIALGLMMCVLGGYIANSIAGRPGIVAGFVGGFAATKGQFSLLYFLLSKLSPSDPWVSKIATTSAGFLGAIAAGFIAGYIVLLLKDKVFNRLPKSLEGVRDMMFIPLLSTFLVGMCMLILNVPLAYLNIGISEGLTQLNKLHLTLFVAFLVAALMATDMGGPINKAAHYFALGLITQNPTDPLAQGLVATNVVGIIVPPVAIALAIWLFPQKFSKQDRKAAIANTITGCCGITEGAIPFVVKDPIRVIAATMIGAGCGGLLAFSWGAKCISPEGGWITMLVMGAECYKGIIATIVGVVIAALILGVIKEDEWVGESQLGNWKGIQTQWIFNWFAKINYANMNKICTKSIAKHKQMLAQAKDEKTKEKESAKIAKLEKKIARLKFLKEKRENIVVIYKRGILLTNARNKVINAHPEIKLAKKELALANKNNDKAFRQLLKIQDKIDALEEELTLTKKKQKVQLELDKYNKSMLEATQKVEETQKIKQEKAIAFSKFSPQILKESKAILAAK